MEGPLLFIRTEANVRVALGHLRRCLSVAQAARSLGYEVKVMCEDDPALMPMVNGVGAEFVPAVAEIGSDEDAEVLISEFRAAKRRVIFLLDSYQVTEKYMHTLRSAGATVAIIDDIADRRFECDFLINGTASAGELQHLGQIGKKLLGPRYVPLSKHYREKREPRASEKVNTLLVTLGGVDHYSLTELTIESLQMWKEPLSILVPIGPFYENLSAIETWARESRHEVKLLFQQDGLFEPLSKSDFAISAGGQTLYEIAALGCPAIGIALWPNQVQNVQSLGRLGALEPLFYQEGKEFREQFAAALFRLLADPIKRAEMAKIAVKTVDGLGAIRIVQEVMVKL
ncbi:MAG: UDP-2,4-diacetamido-2,4,6-trideoxy-beta-L-altropyranose hydrolase [Bdellovibrionota bacterium]